ncbi:bifunctional glutamine synthetase adenylyltransferase/deadenyltransferase [Denitratisoma sp. DHT3]|uniref:bifunctional [glutamate--ammonia ligase]-adenylyl-L-tyrosine phosphorylase/[glutamate--ammonia-ligase] adenylyltransferase n=1 Tax=Denitratisoma sp. DHT3 TaxID=1981880 RepID=UPI001198A3D8|nr:bifunctional [glutamate--ammonia ligase]-adenylyl-L-tyrosine phosphorylase/[glutamate--ammonia-ligase] adenylyltransferase [Denitratisoma sp. DHT3]QDX81394.1 bifunctional glutamine synthetase adenylyltransferase/deadenyltransferase [Denitratisoma sp. DHT3]
MPAFDNALSCSRYLSRLLEAQPTLAEDLRQRWQRAPDAPALTARLAATPIDEDTLKPALRRFKQWAYAWVGLRDLAGLAPLAEVTETMTLIADLAVDKSLEVLSAALEARYGAPRNARGERQQLIVIGMGKLGGRELNVSSDIDLIFVYPDDGDTDGERSISNFEYFTRLGRQLIAAISEPTADGQVFRVDMRLRPNGDSGPLVCSFDMLENYFITQGREWERYAWIKARPMTGGRWDELEAIRRPFVFRKYLDFGAINAMRGLHAQIRREVAKKDMATHVKLGPGGIREIEFIAQVFQLIRGGRDLSLQLKPTLQVLPLLAERGILTLADALALAAAYDFLRRLEHRLQYLDDAQTHRLPDNPADQAAIARNLGFVSYEALLMELDAHRETVSQHFEQVFSDPNRDGHDLDKLWLGAEEQATEELGRLGFREPAAAAERLAALRGSGRYQQMAQGIRERFDALVPRALAAATERPNPDQTLARLLDLLETISRRAAYLALLQQYPQALGKVAQVMSSSSWAAEYLQRHPILLDELLDARLLEAKHDWAGFRAELEQRLADVEPDTERQMDLLREAHHAQVFRLLTQDISGLLQLEKLSDHLSELADIIVDQALRFAWNKLATRHRDAPGFAVISYGKLGGKELGYASDLDLVYLFEDDDADAGRIYSRLSTRLSTWLSAQTPAGQLFETDLRLRPNGDAGLPVVSIDAFRQYQLENAWTWEHQALTRARFSAGDAAVGAKFEQVRVEILRQQRDPAKLREDVLAMRQRMYDAHATKGEAAERIFNLKQDPGGLIDVEFLVQYLVLGNAHAHPELCGNLGNIALLRIAAELGLIPAEQAETVRDAYREYRRLQHALRLNNQKSKVERLSVLPEIEAVRALWRVVFDA